MQEDPQFSENEATLILGERALKLRRQYLSYGEISLALHVTPEEAFYGADHYWKSIERKRIECKEMIRERELAKLDALERRWLPLALHEFLEIASEPGKSSPARIAATALDAGLKSVGHVLKITALRAKILNPGGKPEPAPTSKHLTIDEARQRLKDAGVLKG